MQHNGQRRQSYPEMKKKKYKQDGLRSAIKRNMEDNLGQHYTPPSDTNQQNEHAIVVSTFEVLGRMKENERKSCDDDQEIK